jgi:YteA family regulatory protein
MTNRKLDVEKFREVLLEEQARLKGQTRRIQRRDEYADQSDEMSELADYDNHPADIATETFEREKDLALDENIDDILDSINRALEKIDEGTYGICDRCGNNISKARLEALPYASFCIECQDIIEGR